MSDRIGDDKVRRDELKLINKRRSDLGRPTVVPGQGVGDIDWTLVEGMTLDLSGLALSGGGIRSAAFCMGALQALQARGLMDRFDYLSSVSGGWLYCGDVARLAAEGRHLPVRAGGVLRF